MKLTTTIFLLAWMPFVNVCSPGVADGSSSTKQGAELLKTDIMGVFAHPDDETGISPTLASYGVGQGKVVATTYCTRGEGGGNMVGTQWGASLGVLREAELRECLIQLGVRYCYFLDQEDFFYTESLAATMRKWGKEKTLERLVRYIRALRPDVLVTMNPAPTPGQHGHHQAAAVLATEAFEAAADPNRFPEQLRKEGLSTWQTRKLYYAGAANGPVAMITVTNLLSDGRTPARIAGEAMASHRSQAFGNAANSPWMRRPQSFTLVKSIVPATRQETDLLEGLSAPDLARFQVQPPPSRQDRLWLSLNFRPRPAIASYREWTKSQGIENIATQLPADVPVVVGEKNDIKLDLSNAGVAYTSGEIVLKAPTGWTLKETLLKFRLAPGEFETLQVGATPPPGTLADAELIATILGSDAGQSASVRLHPVPHAIVPRIRSSPALNGTDAGWEALPRNSIPETNLIQGQIKDTWDSSATFRLAHNGRVLFVDVDVNDNMVVTNIAPGDIRGHWRTDSVEICIDPVGGEENTTGCFKVGIFPFDTTGVVRAARDADANQGPVEQTAPTMHVHSSRSTTGYRIQAAIPFREIGISSRKTRGIGFNVIIYDGDKADAAVGENINKSRIAWAPRAGVQGRPEDWGRIDLN